MTNEITNLIAEMLSQHNDGFTQKYYRDKLIEIRDNINRTLEVKQ